MSHFIFLVSLLLSLSVIGQYPVDSIIVKHKVRKLVVTLITPYQKSVSESSYNKQGRKVMDRVTDFNTENSGSTQTLECQSVYQDSFLIKERVKVYNLKRKVVNSGEVLFGYKRETPFRRLWRSEKKATGESEMEQYFYNRQGQLDSISILSNDSSYSNGLRYSGTNLFYKTIVPQKTSKYLYSPNGALSQSTECSNYYKPLHSLDSAGCIRITYTKQGDTLIQNIKQWNYAGRELNYAHKQVVKDGWVVYEDRGGEKSITVLKKNKKGLVAQAITTTYPPQRKQWTAKTKYEYFFWD